MKNITLRALAVVLLVSTSFSGFCSVVTAKGFGTVDGSQFPSGVQAKLMAKRAAMVDAQRQLAEVVRGVRITGGTTVREYEVQSDVVATRVKGMLRGFFVINQKVDAVDGDFVAEVELGICQNDADPQCQGKMTIDSLLEGVTDTQE